MHSFTTSIFYLNDSNRVGIVNCIAYFSLNIDQLFWLFVVVGVLQYKHIKIEIETEINKENEKMVREKERESKQNKNVYFY